MLKKMCIAALLCGAMAAPCLAQNSRWSFGIAIANASLEHPFENPPEPGQSGSGTIGVYGGILEKNYGATRYSMEAQVQYGLKRGALRLRGGYSLREARFSSVYASPSREPVSKSTIRETARGWHIAPGYVAAHQLGKFALNAGVELPLHFFSALKSYSTWTNLNETDNNFDEAWRFFPGGFAAGVGPVAGLAFQPGKRWSIGLEARTALLYTRHKGNFRESNTLTGQQIQKGTAETYEDMGLANVQVAFQLRFML